MASKRRRTSRSSRRTSRGGPLKEALQSFFTNTVPLPTCPRGTATGSIWWELRDGWKYPWRIVKFTRGVAQGYPCSEPVIATAAAVRKPYGNTAPRAVPVKAVATNKGMLKGYWKVAIVDAEGHEIEVAERVQSRNLARDWADEMNARGSYTTGISGFRYEQLFGHPLRHS